jgi:hypothetical protein
LPEEATTSKTHRICQTDPDASLGKGGRLPRVEPAYKQQTAVDAKQGVILDVEVTTGSVHDSKTLSALDEVPRVTGRSITIATLRARLKPSFQHGASHLRKKGLFPPVGSNWMRDTIVSSVREAGILCRTANKCGGHQSLSLKHSRLPLVSAQTLSAMSSASAHTLSI